MHMIGAYTGTIVNSSGNRNRMHQFAGFLGRRPDFQMDFMNGATFATMVEPWIPQGWRKFDTTTMVITVPLIPANVTAGGAAATLAAAAAGTYNSYYVNLMAKYQEAGLQNAIIRLGHEFNGTWYPWRADGGKESAFAGAWRQAVTQIRNSSNGGGSGVSFRFDWCPTWGTPSDCDVEACYPGDEYVDVIGLDVYNQHFPFITDPAGRWNAIRTNRYGLDWQASFAAARGKPISFPEWGTGLRMSGGVPENPQNGGGDDPTFVRNMAAWINSHPVLYHSYWDFQAPDLDTRLSDYIFPKTTQAYRAAFRKE